MIGSIFLMNLLCAMVPCDYFNRIPEVEYGKSSDGYVRGKRLIQEDYPIVSTANGKVQGYPMMTMSGRRVFAFEGIPYADAPIRFQNSIPVGNWSGVRQAFSPGPYCLQMHVSKLMRVTGAEHGCLTLNVYTPKIPTQGLSGNLDVIVYIHGGSFAFGAGAEFGPSYLLEKDVVLVNMNYRVGVLGFLSTGDAASPGNYGLKDQLLALRWVKENIAAFGGNPESVTLMGQSAGAVAAHLHSMNPVSSSYFQKAILASGSAHTHWGVQNASLARKWSERLAKNMRCPHSTSYEIVECLRGKNANWLVAAQMNLFDWMPFPPIIFAPVVEPASPDAIISKIPLEISKSGGEAKIPMIFSMTAEEGFLANYALNGLMKVGSFINNVRGVLPYYLDYYYITNSTQRVEVTNKVLNYYLGKRNPRNVLMNEYAKMGTDRMFANSINHAIKHHASQGPTYVSLFSYSGKYNMGYNLGVPKRELGVAHTEDLYYIFNASTYMPAFLQSDKETELSKIMINLITNFARLGKPMFTAHDESEMEIWDPVNSCDEEIRVLQLNEDIKMINDPFVNRRKFWESLGLKDIHPVLRDSNCYENLLENDNTETTTSKILTFNE